MQIDLIRRCKRYGNFGRKLKYCPSCAILADKEKARGRSRRYRERHGNENVKKWVKEHPEEKKLISRNYIHRHKEEQKARLKAWRAKNPDKWREQNKRAKSRLKIRKRKRKYNNTVYKEKVLAINKQFYIDNPTYQYDYYRNTKEVFVASTCAVCGEIIAYKGKGRLPLFCDFCVARRKTNRIKKYHEQYYKINQMDAIDFINYEKQRLGLNKNTKWTTGKINRLYSGYK